jgi:hypothetical protein
MSSRARMFAAVTLLISCLAGSSAWAQAQNLEAGKSASQLFAGTCNACHKSPRGLLKTVSPGSLTGFLREHYTTSGDMASQLATFLISNGASDARQAKQGADKQGADKPGGTDQADRPGRKSRNAPTQEAAPPDDAAPANEGGRQNRKRLTRPAEQPDEARPVANAPAATDDGADVRRPSAKQRGRLAKPGTEEPSITNTPPKESGADDKPRGGEAIGNVGAKPDAESKPSEAKSEPAQPEPVKPEAAKIDPPKDSSDKSVARRDPVPQVTPAPAAASAPAPAPAVTSGGGSSEPAPPKPPTAPVAAPAPEAVTAAAPPPPPAGGPPAPPISR